MDTAKTGKYIREKRIALGLTQKELAEKLNCTDKAISRWETGKGFPEPSLLEPLATTLNVTVNELVLGEDIATEHYTEKTDKVIVDTIKTTRRSLNIQRIVIIIFFVLLSALVIKQISTLEILHSALEKPVQVNPYSYFENPQDAIYDGLNYAKEKMDDQSESIKSYEYKQSVFKTEDDNSYVEFFVSNDDYTVWCFLVDKKQFGDTTKYRTNYYENNVIHSQYDWSKINNECYYKVAKSEEDIKNYNEVEPIVTEFEITTVNGKETLYLMVVDTE